MPKEPPAATEAAGGTAISAKCDLTKQADVENPIKETTAAFEDRIDTMVNYAGGLMARKCMTKMD